jgi:2-(1,2-epoxy-1,2-dihydrophenyl)acetyl-CoA isomerase
VSEHEVLANLDAGVLTLTLNRPDALNAATDPLLEQLHEGLRGAGRDGSVRVVIITGAGRGFCAGQDLQAVQGRKISFKAHLEKTYNQVISRIRSLEKPVIGAINGVAAGAGFSLALACDLRIASSAASFVPAFSRIGLIPDSGMSYHLPRLVGYQKAYELLVTSPKLSAADALALRLVERVVPADDFEAAVRELASQLAAGPTRAFGLTKRALQRNSTATHDEALAYEAALQELAGRSEDYREGTQAFREKRAPRFTGR